MQHYGDSVKEAKKSECEDVHFDITTRLGNLCVVLDFSHHNFTNLHYRMKNELAEVVKTLDQLEWPGPELFLGYVAKEINNHVYRFGQEYCAGRLFCVAAMCLLDRNRLTYLAYGDARVNIFDGQRLVLLNGAKYMVPAVVSEGQNGAKPIDENPEQFGRKYFDNPLSERAHSLTLRDSDMVLLFSDGVEEVLAPAERLKHLKRVAAAEPKEIYEAIMQATTAVQDDRTLVVIKGAYGHYEEPLSANLSTRVGTLRTELEGIIKAEGKRGNDELKGLDSRLAQNFRELEAKLKQYEKLIGGKANASDFNAQASLVAELKTRVDSLEVDRKVNVGGKRAGGKKKETAQADDEDTRESTEQLIHADSEAGTLRTVDGQGSGQAEAGETKVVQAREERLKEASVKQESQWPITYNAGDSKLYGLLGISPDNIAGGVIRVMLLVLAGIMLPLLLSLWKGGDAPAEAWHVKASDNLLTLRPNVANENQAVVLRMAQQAQRGWETEVSVSSIKQLADFLNQSGLAMRPEATGTTASPVPQERVSTLPPPTEGIEVTVKPGHTLERLSSEYKTPLKTILELNPQLKVMRNNRETIRPLQAGEKIVVLNNATGGTR